MSSPKQPARRLPTSVIVAIVISVLGLCLTATTINVSASAPNPTQAYVAGQLLVQYKPGYRQLETSQAISHWGMSRLRSFPSIDTDQLKLPDRMSVAQALHLVAAEESVEYAEPNYLRYASQSIPNDVLYGDQWGVNNIGQLINGAAGDADWDIDAPEAWELATGRHEVIVAVIDSGIDSHHPDLARNLWSNTLEIPDNGVDDDHNGFIDDIHGWNFLDHNNRLDDDYNHGTQVAGILGAEGNNAEGVVGVCWRVSIMSLKFMDPTGAGNLADSIAAIEYACRQGAKIINASYGDIASSELEYQAILAAQKQGVLFIAAAGNHGFDNDVWGFYPSSYDLDNIISVTAANAHKQLPDFADFGVMSVDVAAPGEAILTTSASNGDTDVQGSRYQYMQGTSAAVPFVSGVAALLLSYRPVLSYQQVKQCITQGANDGHFKGTIDSGGMVNAYNSLLVADSMLAEQSAHGSCFLTLLLN